MNTITSNGASVTQMSAAEAAATESSPGFFKATWERWGKFAHAIGVVQTRILMVIFYILFVFPLGLVVRMADDKLQIREPKNGYWGQHRPHEHSLDGARKQF